LYSSNGAAELPPLLRGAALVELIKNCWLQAGSGPGKFFLHANVVLTLAHCRGETEIYVEGLAASQKDLLLTTAELLKSHGTVFQRIKPPNLLVFRSRNGLRRTALQSRLPEISACSELRDDHPEWRSQLAGRLEQGPYFDWATVMCGLLRGYPDRALLDFDQWLQSGRSPALEAAPILGADLYKCAQPVFDYLPEHRDDPGIVGVVGLWSEILREFYLSEWHLSVNPAASAKLS